MDWIHCNNCFSQMLPGVTLHLTSCGHMFCNKCLENGKEASTCLLCRAPCSVMKLVPDMQQEIQEYFTEPEDIIKKCSEVLQFQKKHRKRLISYLLQSTKKFYKARTELQRMTEICQKQQTQLKESQNVIKKLQLQVEELTSTPKQTSPFTVAISPGDNMSPGFLQSTPTYKRTAKSTPFPRSSTSNKISSTVFTPPTPLSSGYTNFIKDL